MKCFTRDHRLNAAVAFVLTHNLPMQPFTEDGSWLDCNRTVALYILAGVSHGPATEPGLDVDRGVIRVRQQLTRYRGREGRGPRQAQFDL